MNLPPAVKTRAVELAVALVRIVLDHIRNGLLLKGSLAREAVGQFRRVGSFEEALINGIGRFVRLMLLGLDALAVLLGVLVREAAAHDDRLRLPGHPVTILHEVDSLSIRITEITAAINARRDGLNCKI